MPGRNANLGSYRYGFQNQETDPEMLGGAVSFKYRVHDARIGRFLSVDPLFKKYPYNSSYAFQENKLGMGIEFEGLELQQTQKVGGVETIKGENGEMVGQVSNEPVSTNSVSPIILPIDKPQEPASTPSTPTFSPQATISKPRMSEEGQKILTFQGKLKGKIEEFQKADPFMYGGSGNGMGLANSLFEGLKQTPGIVVPEIAFPKVYEALKMSSLSWNQFRTLNKGVFMGPNYMQKASLGYQSHKLLVINYNQNLFQVLRSAELGLSVEGYFEIFLTPVLENPHIPTSEIK